MNCRSAKQCSIRPVVLVLLMITSVVTGAHGQMIDLNTNGMSDVWEQIYGASGLAPDADTDGDGVINRLEAIAATDPFDPTSYPAIAGAGFSGTNFTVNVACALGKQYQLQSC